MLKELLVVMNLQKIIAILSESNSRQDTISDYLVNIIENLAAKEPDNPRATGGQKHDSI